MIISAGATIIGVGFATIGVAIVERSMYKRGKEHVGYIINRVTKTILIIGGLTGFAVLLFHAFNTLLGG